MRAIGEWLVGGEGFAFSWEGLSRRRGRWVRRPSEGRAAHGKARGREVSGRCGWRREGGRPAWRRVRGQPGWGLPGRDRRHVFPP